MPSTRHEFRVRTPADAVLAKTPRSRATSVRAFFLCDRRSRMLKHCGVPQFQLAARGNKDEEPFLFFVPSAPCLLPLSLSFPLPPPFPRPSAFLPPSRFPSCFCYFPSTNSLLFLLSCRLGFPFPPFLLPLLLLLSVPHPCRSPNSTQEGSNHWPASLRMYVLTTELGHTAAPALYGKHAHAFSKACAKPIPS